MSVVNLGIAVHDLWRDVELWSDKTFGPVEDRGPIGPLKHLEKEAKEAQKEPYDIKEYADCLIVLIDATRRAGFDERQLIKAAKEKMQVNRSRQWPKPVKDEPCEHIRTEETPET